MSVHRARPLVRYHGGKWRIAPWIIEHFPLHQRYVEPFGGGASVLLRKPRAYAEVYNDLDGEVVNLFRCVRDHGDELRRRVALTPFARAEFIASCSVATDDPIEQARRTIVRSYMGFGSASVTRQASGFRFNSTRSGSTPAHDWATYPEAFGRIIERLRGVVIENRDAVDCIRQNDSAATLHYVDPPYVHGTRYLGGAKHAYSHEMTDAQHVALAETLHHTEGGVILSGYRCELYDDLFRTWSRVDRVTYADGAGRRTESLWLSPGIERMRAFARDAGGGKTPATV